jgi:hypothetical protein
MGNGGYCMIPTTTLVMDFEDHGYCVDGLHCLMEFIYSFLLLVWSF